MTTGREIHISLPSGPMQPRKLLDSIEKFAVPGDSPTRWMAGVRWQPQLCRALTVDNVDVCAGVDQVAADTPCVAWSDQLPFRISDALSASSLEFSAAELLAMSLEFWPTAISAAFAAELVAGAGSGGDSLSSVATAPVGAAFNAAASLCRNAVAILEDEIAIRLQGRAGFIFLPPGLLAQAVHSYGLRLTESGWETPAGNRVISDAGFVAAGAPTGGTAAGASEDWVYASGPVFYQESAPKPVGVGSEVTDMTRNTFLQYVEGYGILVFDPCPVTAVRVSYATV